MQSHWWLSWWCWSTIWLNAALGVYLGASLWPEPEHAPALVMLLLLGAALTWRAKARDGQRVMRAGLVVVAWAFGALLIVAHELGPSTSPEAALLESGQLCGQVQAPPRLGRRGLMFELRPAQWPAQRVEVSLGDALLAHHKRASAPLPGDALCVLGQVSEPGQLRRFPWTRDHGQLRRLQHKSVRLEAHTLPMIDPIEPHALWQPLRVISAHKLRLEGELLRGLGRARAGFIVAMALGNRELLSPAQTAPFMMTGTSHLLAISGLHLGFIAALLWGLWRAVAMVAPAWAERRGLWRAGIGVVMLGLTSYVLAVGAPTSALRALGMVAAWGVGLALRRRTCPMHALMFASATLLCIDPALILSPAYQLSLSATLGILLTIRRQRATRVAQDRQRLSDKAMAYAALSASAWIATAPVVLDLTRELPIAGLALNLVMVPLVGAIIFPMMVFGVMALPIVPALALPALRLSTQAMIELGALCELALTMPGSYWRPGDLAVSWLLASAAGVWLFLGSEQRRWRAVGVALALMSVCAPSSIRRHGAPTLQLAFLPVGQGDATFLRAERGQTLLIDGGGAHMGADPGMVAVLPALRQYGVHHLDAVVLTHPDLDHLEGLFAVVRWACPQRLYYNEAHAQAPRLRALIELASASCGAQAIPVTQAWQRVEGFEALWLWRPQGRALTEPNDQSLTVVLERGPFRTAFTGDLEQAGEAALLRAGLPRLTLWKLGHHGSKTSTTPALLERAQPALGVVSCGLDNRYGHPHPKIMARLEAANAPVYRTDQQGLIQLTLRQGGAFIIEATNSGQGSARDPVENLKKCCGKSDPISHKSALNL